MKEKLEDFFYRGIYFLERILGFSRNRNFKNVAEKIFGISETKIVEKKTVGFKFGDEPYHKSEFVEQPIRTRQDFPEGQRRKRTTENILNSLQYSKIGYSYILRSNNKELTKEKELLYQGTENLFSKNFFKSYTYKELLENRAKNTTLFMVLAIYQKSISKKPRRLRKNNIIQDMKVNLILLEIERAEKLLGHLTKPFKK